MPNDSPGHLFRNIMGIPEFEHRLSERPVVAACSPSPRKFGCTSAFDPELPVTPLAS
jgi:hypothetical protein